MKHYYTCFIFMSCLLPVCWLATPLQAQQCPSSATLYVDSSKATSGDGSSWSSAYKELREALADAARCSSINSILIAKGTYKPTSTNNRDTSFALLRGGLKLYGGYSSGGGMRNITAYPTILSGDLGTGVNSYHVVVIAGLTSSADSVVLDGLTITRGNANGNSNKTYYGVAVVSYMGGGIVLQNNSGAGNRIAVRNCIFSNNTSIYSGGMYNKSSSPVLTNCTFSNNSGNSGSGMYNESSSSPVLTSCSFSNNTSSSLGGGMYNSSSSPMLTNCTFSGNTGSTNGSGMYNESSSSPVLTNCSFSNNSSSLGGGMYNISSSPVLTACSFSNNSSSSLGGGMYNESSSSPVLTNCSFSNNTGINGSGMYNKSSFPMLTNCTFSSNNSSGMGGGMYNASSSSPVLTNCSFSNNTSNNYGSGGGMCNLFSSPVLTSCTFFNNTSSNYGGGMYNGSSSPVLTSCTFTANTSGILGGGMYNFSSSSPVLTSCTFTANISSQQGGAIYHSNVGKLTLKGCLFQSNTSPTGGAVRLADDPSFTAIGNTFYQNTASGNNGGALSLVMGTGSDTIINNVFAQNRVSGNGASNGGGAFVQEGGSNSFIVNNTFYADTAASNGGAIRFQNGGSNRYLYNNIFYKSYNGTDTTSVSLASGTTITAQGNNLYGNVNPLFVNEASLAGADGIFGTADDGLRLQAGSPAVNSGSNAAVPSGIITDITSAARIQAGTVDIGAYEGFACPSYTKLYVDSNRAVSGNGSSWSSAFKELRDALAVASQCSSVDSILVAKGTYKPTADNDRDTSFALLRGGLKLYGGYNASTGIRNTAANPTILSGDLGSGVNSYHVMVIAGLTGSADSVVLDGLTVTRGNANGYDSKTYNGVVVQQNNGGGIILQNNSGTGGRIAIRNCTFSNNTSSSFGGGMFNSSSPVLTGCTFTANTSSSSGGGMYNDYSSSPVLKDCTFSNNTSSSFGGGMFNSSSSPILTNCTFTANNSDYGGGMRNNESSSPVLTSCTFSNNSSKEGGGMLNTSSSPVLTGCTFTANTGTFGGGMSNASSSPEFTYCIFSDNSSGRGGGMLNKSSSPVLTSCTFSNNNSIVDGGGAILHGDGGKLTLKGCLFQSNTAPTGGAARLAGNSSFIAIGNTFYQNTASGNNGGALSLIMGTGSDTLINNVFAQNRASGNGASNGGGAFVQEGGSNSFIVNNTFYADTAASNGGAIRFQNGGSNRYLYNNIFYKSYNGIDTTSVSLASGTVITGQGNNLYGNVNPLFANEASLAGADGIFGTADDGLRLQAGSPAVNSGSNAAVPSGITTDITGDARIQAGTVDIGAYESPFANSIATAVSNTNICVGATLTVTYTAEGTFAFTNTFTAQLSNAAGSFASPISIGSVTAPAGSTINATIPANTPAGSAYRIRVVASNPAIVGSDNGTNITVNALPATPTLTVTQPTCSVSTGTITVNTPIGTEIIYSINGTDYQTGTTFSNVTPGTYNVTAKNSSGCVSSSAPAIINAAPADNQPPSIPSNVTVFLNASGQGNLTPASVAPLITDNCAVDPNSITVSANNFTCANINTGGPHQAYIANTSTGNQAFRGEMGMDFTVNNPNGIQVNQLGAFDHQANGITGTQSGGVRVAIFNRATQAIVPGLNVIISGSADPLVANHRMKNIPPVTLMPGNYVIVAKGYNAAELNGNVSFGGGPFALGDNGSGAITYTNRISWGNDNAAASFVYPPNSTTASTNEYLAGSFNYAIGSAGTANSVTIGASDRSGNPSSVVAVVTVVDTSYTITTRNITVNLDGSGHATLQPSDVLLSLKNNCGATITSSTLQVSPSTLDCSDINGNAGVPHKAYVSNTATGNQAYLGEVGMDFTVNASSGIQINQLGAFDHQSNGINGTQSGGVRVAIFNKSTQIIVPGLDIVIVGLADGLIANHRMRSIPAVTLMPGNYVIVAKGYNAAELNGNAGVSGGPFSNGDNGGGAITYTNRISWGTNNSFPSFTYPPNAQAGSTNEYHAGTFSYLTTPVSGTVVTLKATDVYGNTDSMTATVTVVDMTAPALPTNLTVALDASGHATIQPANVVSLITDNCAVNPSSITVSPNSFDCSNVSGSTPVPHQAYVSNTATGNQAYLGEMGMDFTVNTPNGIRIDQLGAFDHQSNGISGTQSGGVRVAIFNRATQTIVPGLNVIISGSADPLVSNHRMRSIPTVTLMPGNYVIVAKGYNAGELNGNAGVSGGPFAAGDNGSGAITYTNRISWGANNSSTSFGFPPNSTTASTNEYHAGTFNYTLNTSNTVTISASDRSGNVSQVTANVMVTDPNHSCTTAPAPVIAGSISPGAQLKELVPVSKLSVYPNPTSGVFNVVLSHFSGATMSIEITDGNGKLVAVKALTLNSKTPVLTVPFDLYSKASGMYWIKIVSATGVQTEKLQIQR